ncbi:hypothetical protein [Deinococcus multiflagellatus]|uniref:Uncharacterized protein n=1 Tax=Deinococcus multiflagellatus TaxID=1656887 RepID=A0ABW1ZRU3_9DEIO|nr:hypothetical protein [Deinococcus multiflagellatus]MBZ9715156.1 hypothetical protein [Deinococcus multiflagellatus]
MNTIRMLLSTLALLVAFAQPVHATPAPVQPTFDDGGTIIDPVWPPIWWPR